MAIRQRPGFPVNVERTAKVTEKTNVYFDLKPGQSVNLRFTPPSDESGELFFVSAQHFKMKQEGQPRAYACLRAHGVDQECPICVFLERIEEVFADNDTLREKLHREHDVAYRWHAQVVPVPKEGQGLAEQTYVIGLSKATADKVSKILMMEKDNRLILLTDPDEGQAINISRNEKTGFGTRYEVMPTGLRMSLDAITTVSAAGVPAWEEKFLNVRDALKLRIEKPESLYPIIAETVGIVAFAKVFPEVTL